MFLLASSIFEKSRKPLRIIRSVPNEGWCQEIERFADQIKIEVNALSGMNFFYLTRKVLFGLGGTILTYELVLLQFNNKEAEIDALVNCKG
jgi:gustatory receptor